ncbi:YjjG family noncanonical pyrimidine nucleotidase [Clostridium sardiniense]|uniref:YjjG family noncanonical pyrimidine nucleotidase n=1 Tax=Clostridium sardiniense TaxID=29369 RepID=UPI003D34DE04
MKYEVLLFDIDETLFDFKKGENFAFLKCVDDFNLSEDKEACIKLYREINTLIWQEFEKGLITSKDLKVDRFRRLIKALNIERDAEEISNTYMRYLGMSTFLFDGVEELINELSKDYRLAIVTNGLKETQTNRINKSTIGKYFDAVIISDGIGIAKPDARIFEYALDRINYKDKSKVLMIGDSLTADIKGGINAEIDTCLYNPDKKVNDTDIKPTYEIHKLEDLKNIL